MGLVIGELREESLQARDIGHTRFISWMLMAPSNGILKGTQRSFFEPNEFIMKQKD